MGCGQSSQTSSPQASAKEKNDQRRDGESAEVESVKELNSNMNGKTAVKASTKNGNEAPPPVRSPVSHLHVPTDSQVDFFKMLDNRIESGPDYVSIREEKIS